MGFSSMPPNLEIMSCSSKWLLMSEWDASTWTKRERKKKNQPLITMISRPRSPATHLKFY